MIYFVTVRVTPSFFYTKLDYRFAAKLIPKKAPKRRLARTDTFE
jgi:hypothetical protein